MTRKTRATLAVAACVAIVLPTTGCDSLWYAARKATHGVTSIPNYPHPPCSTSRDVCRGGRTAAA